MPSRTYTGVDLTGYVVNSSYSNPAPVVATPTQGSATVTNDITDNDSGGVSATANAEQSGTTNLGGFFDFDAFPPIPNNAAITKVKLTLTNPSANINSSGSVSGTDVPPISSYSIHLTGSTLSNGVGEVGAAVGGLSIARTATIPEQTNAAAGSSASLADSDIASGTDSVELDLSGSPITKAELASTYPGIGLSCSINIRAEAIVEDVDNDASATANVTYALTLDNFQFEVTYIEGALNIILNPAGGNVESGQQITVTSPDVDVQELEYAALQGDKVIPLKISPNGTLTIPEPPTDPCTDCLGDCPNCETCLAACTDNLEGEECQACMQSCLDCLGDCLENLEKAEECQDSTQDPPADIDIVIVCASPGGQFSGSVPLGNFTILLTNGSGIYRFIPGKTNDTLYSSSRDGTTYDVKIPNPSFKTGFFRS